MAEMAIRVNHFLSALQYIPGAFLGSGFLNGFFISFHIVVPKLALVNIGCAEENLQFLSGSSILFQEIFPSAHPLTHEGKT